MKVAGSVYRRVWLKVMCVSFCTFILAVWYLNYVRIVTVCDGRTLLVHAIREGNSTDVGRILRTGTSPNFTISLGETPIGVARRTGRTDVVRLLEQYGAR